MKTCYGCNKNVEEFAPREKKCKPCKNKRNKKWYLKNRKSILEDLRKTYPERKDAVNKQHREHYHKNKEQYSRRANKWGKAHPEIQREWRKKNPAKNRYSLFRGLAKYRGIECYLSFEEWFKIVKSPCAYCGDIDLSGFNTVDRIDSCLNYSLSNCTSACIVDNIAKSTRSPAEYKAHSKRVVNHDYTSV